MIQLVNVSLAFGGQTILDRVTWTIKPGQSIGLIGPNGAGKSTLLRVIADRQQLDEGDIAISGGTTIGFLEQEPKLDDDKTVLENIEPALQKVKDARRFCELVTQCESEGDDDFVQLVSEMMRASVKSPRR